MEQLKSILEGIEEQTQLAKAELDRLVDKGNKSSATRVRNHMQTIKTLAQELRVGAQEYRESLPTKKR